MARAFFYLAAMALCAGLTAAAPSSAAVLPFHVHGEQNIDKGQIGYSDVSVNADGLVTISTKFSNGKRIGGNNFYAVTYFFDSNDKPIQAFVQWKGLDGSFFGHAREGTVTDRFHLDGKQVAKLDHVGFRFGVKNCGFQVTGLVLENGNPKNGVTMSTVECGNLPK